MFELNALKVADSLKSMIFRDFLTAEETKANKVLKEYSLADIL